MWDNNSAKGVSERSDLGLARTERVRSLPQNSISAASGTLRVPSNASLLDPPPERGLALLLCSVERYTVHGYKTRRGVSNWSCPLDSHWMKFPVAAPP